MKKPTSFAAITMAIFFAAHAIGLSAEPTHAPTPTKLGAGQFPATVDPARKLKNRPVLSAGSGKNSASLWKPSTAFMDNSLACEMVDCKNSTPRTTTLSKRARQSTLGCLRAMSLSNDLSKISPI